MIIAQVIMVGVVIGIVLTFDTIKQRKIAKALQKSKEESWATMDQKHRPLATMTEGQKPRAVTPGSF